MISIILVAAVMFFILLVVEVFSRQNLITGEIARKTIHMSGGVVAAFLPFWIHYDYIVILAILALCASFINTKYNIFKAGKDVARKSYGDVLFGLGILIAAVMRPNKWLFAAAILQVAVADGMAAVIGVTYAKRTYKVLGNKKSYVGTATFYTVSWLIVLVCLLYSGPYSLTQFRTMMFASPLILTVIENFGNYGLDNLLLPVSFLLLAQVLL